MSFNYQWYQGQRGDTSNPVSGGTSSSLTVAPDSTTSYWCRVSNSFGQDDSRTAQITVIPAPVIVTQPLSAFQFNGVAATLGIFATDPSGFDLSYQWYRGVSGDTSNPVAGETDAVFNVPVLGATTSYWVRVSNYIAHTDSNTAQVVVGTLSLAWTPGYTVLEDTTGGLMTADLLDLSADNSVEAVSLTGTVGCDAGSPIPDGTMRVVKNGTLTVNVPFAMTPQPSLTQAPLPGNQAQQSDILVNGQQLYQGWLPAGCSPGDQRDSILNTLTFAAGAYPVAATFQQGLNGAPPTPAFAILGAFWNYIVP